MSNLILNSYLEFSFPFEVSTVYNNTKLRSYSGREVVINHSQYDMKKYNIQADALTRTEMKTFLDFYNDHMGEYDSFLFYDAQNGFVPRCTIGTGTGSLFSFQLKDEWGFDRFNIRETPIDAKVWSNNVLKTKTTHYNITYLASGICLFTGGNAPGNGHVVEAEFYYTRRVRFGGPLVTGEVSYDNISLGFELIEVVP
jgi:uncharacterized protein (TIGR02217 family)